MCSGCSGNYDSDFEDSEATADPGAAPGTPWISNRLEAHRKPPGAGDTGRFEGMRGLAHVRVPPVESTAETCEILVSATRIIEVRVVTTNFGPFDELTGTMVAAMAVAREQSKTLLAKYYQTCEIDPQGRHHRAQLGNSHRPAADAAGLRKRWLRWMRSAFGNHASRIPE